MLKVLFITRKWPPAVGGMELYSKELARSLEGRGDVDLEVLALPGRSNGYAPGLFSITMFMFRATWFLIRNSRRFDVVHFGDFVLFPLAVVDRLVSPAHLRCMTVYGLDLTFSRKKGLLPAIYRWYMKLAVANASAIDRYIAISQFTRTVAESLALPSVSVVPLGIRLSAFESATRDREVVSREKVPFVFYLGRVVERKGAFWFAENVLPRLERELVFVVAGRFYSDRDRERLARVPNVRVLGQIPHSEALAYRQAAVAVVMPNIPVENSADVEGFGLTALEAPAAGGVLLASRIEGIEDAVIDGVTGFLISAGDADQWEERLREVIAWDKNRREEFLVKAREELRQHYSWELVAQRTVEQYREALADKKAR